MANNTKNTNSNNAKNKGKQVRKPVANKKSSNKPHGGIIDSDTKKDIIGVVFIVIGAIIFALALIPTDAPVAAFFVNCLKFVFGLGVFIAPFFLAGIGISFFLHMEQQKVTVRATIGSILILIAVLTLISLSAQCVQTHNYELLFESDNVLNYGGIIGSSLAWIGCTLLGNVATTIIMVGLILVGIIVIGLSVSKTFSRIKERKLDIERQRYERNLKKQQRQMYAQANANNNMPGNGNIYETNGNIDTSGQFVDPRATQDIAQATNLGYSEFAQNNVGNGQNELNINKGQGQINAELPENLENSNETRNLFSAGKKRKKRGLKTRILNPKSNQTASLNDIPNSVMGEPTKLLNEDKASSDNLGIANDNVQKSEKESPQSKNGKTQVLDEASGGKTEKIQSNIDKNEPSDKKSKKTRILSKKPDENAKNTDDFTDGHDIKAEADIRNGNTFKTGQGSNAINNAKDADFDLPSFSLLAKPESNNVSHSQSELKSTADNLQNTLEQFGVSAKVVGWVPGPTVTLYKVELPAGIRVSRITALNDDIALALAAPGVRVFAPIPGTTYVGIEVPNSKRQTVLLSEVLSNAKPDGPLQISIGKDVEGNCIVSDLAKMPHLLIGGTTGSGKSVSINAMIMSILMRATPNEVKMILIDPKRVEFTPYNGIPHLYVPVVTEPKEAASALSWGVAEMERRLKVFSQVGVRNIGQYNDKITNYQASGKEDENNVVHGKEKLPYIVIVIDELADLMMAIGKEVEYSISRIAQLARAAGIHLIVATQRPSTNVVTGLIKANITNRIAFNVASGIDSRVIIDTGGAESLIGLGDLLLSKPELSKPLRIQGCFVSEKEIENVVKHLKKQGEPEYHNDILKTNLITINSDNSSSSGGNSNDLDDDTLFWEAAEMIVNAQHGSTSSLQRRFKIGYARAGRIMDMLEEKGVVGPQNGSKPREVLLDSMDLEGLRALEQGDKDPGSVQSFE